MHRLWPIAVALIASSAALMFWPSPQAQPAASAAVTGERNYTATGLVQNMDALEGGACMVQLKLHEWTSMSAGFSLAEMPRADQLYTVLADADNCLAIQVALSEGLQGENVKGHIYYTAGQRPDGSWYFITRPKAPVGCGVM
jgi:hypothetical protein